MGQVHKLDGQNLQQLQHSIRLWNPDDESAAAASTPGSLSPDMTLDQFFEWYFLPVELQANDRSDDTIDKYRQALKRWNKITDHAPLWKIDPILVADYKQKLRDCTYCRGKRGIERPLSEDSIATDMIKIRALIYRVGPQTDPKRETTGILDKAPHLRVSAPKPKLKPSFSLMRARAMMEASVEMTVPEVPNLPAPLWWCGYGAGSFYAGQRVGTTLGLRQKHWIVDEEGWNWLDIPQELVPKTEKPTRVLMHPLLIEVFTAIRLCLGEDPEQLLLPFPHHMRSLQDWQNNLQKLAGIPSSKWLSPQGWRRTHSTECGRTGFNKAMGIASASLDHADIETTKNSYCDLTNEARLRLPALWTKPPYLPEDRQQVLFS